MLKTKDTNTFYSRHSRRRRRWKSRFIVILYVEAAKHVFVV